MAILDKTNYICKECSVHLSKAHYEANKCAFGHELGFLTWEKLYNMLLNDGDINADNTEFDPMDFGWEGFDIGEETYYKEME